MQHKCKRIYPMVIGFLILLLALYVSPVPTVKAAGPEDSYEENDTFATAVNITWGFYELTLFDEDFFRINVSAGDLIHIQLQSNTSVENVELEVFNSSYGFIKGTYNFKDFEELFVSVPEKDYYVIRVYSVDGYYMSDYNLTVNKYLPGQIDDKFDNGMGNDIIENASPIWPDFYTGLILNDSDYYSVHVMPDEDFEIYIYFDPAFSYIEFDIYNETGSIIGSGIHEGMDYVHLYLIATGIEQNLTIHVWETPFSGYAYDMDIWVYGSGPMDDWAEENDNSGETFFLGYGEYDYLFLADEDWFSFDVYNGTNIKIEVYFNHSENDLDFTVYDSMNGEVGGSYGIENNESNEFYCYETGQWKIRIYSASGYNPNPGKYNLTINIGDDLWEENDFQLQAPELVPNYYQNLVMNDNADWYKIWVGQDDNLSVYLYSEPYANLTMNLYDQSGYWILNSSYLYDGAQELDFYNGNISQYYYIVITGEFAIYNLDIWINQDTIDDWAEENDFREEAQWLDINSYYTNLYQWDDDWFYVWLEPHDELTITIWCATIDWTPSLSLYNSEGGWIMDGIYTGDRVYLEYTEGDIGHNWYFRVSGPNMGYWYDIETSLNFGGDDYAEPNNYQGEAYWLDWGYHGTFYQFDNDWYKFPSVSDGQTVHVRLVYDTYNDNLSADLVNQYGNPLPYNVYYQTDGREYIWNVNGYYSEFYLHVWGGNWGQYYDVDVWYESPDDWAEENDYQGEAYWLDWGDYSGFNQFDDDWFQIPGASTGQTVHVHLVYDTYTDLGIELLDEYGNPHGYSILDRGDGKELVWDVAGNYSTEYIRITGPNNGDWYDLHIWWEYTGSTDNTTTDNTTTNDTSTVGNPFENFDFSSIPGYNLPLWTGFSILALSAIYLRISRKRR